MTVCKNVSPTKRKICIGDLRVPIKVQVRKITTKSGSSVDYGESFTDVISVMASVSTKRGFSSFNDIGVTQTGSVLNFTHEFYIRFSSTFSISSENWILYNGDKYNITSIENFEERNEWLRLFAIKKGLSTKKGNFV